MSRRIRAKDLGKRSYLIHFFPFLYPNPPQGGPLGAGREFDPEKNR